MLKAKNFLIICMIFLMAITFVSAGYKIGTDTNITISCENINCSDGDINITVFNQDHTRIIDNQQTVKENGYLYYTLDLSEGSYSYFIASDNDYHSSSFLVTESGVTMDHGRSLLTIGLILILVFLLFMSLYAMFSVENYIGKFALYWVSHVLMILICFVGWQVGVEGLLGELALTGIFRILFWVFTISVLPMIILSGAWIMYIHTFNEHFQKLVDKGMDTESAFAMAKRKSGGWFGGR